MPLTPDDVHKRTFTPVRLREGYDMGEVDQFLDEVEQELIRLHKENDELQAQLAAPASAATPQPAEATAASTAAGSIPDKMAPAGSALESEPAIPPARPAGTTVPEASSAAARLLEIATNNADQLVNEAQNDADRIIGEARTKAERLDSESRSRAESLDTEARTRAQRLDTETSERRKQMVGELERERESVSREVEELRAFEREYRARLKSYFESQLRALDGQDDDDVPVTPAADGDTSGRLRELLGEEQP